MIHLSKRRSLVLGLAGVLALATVPNPVAQAAAGGAKLITATDLKAWLTAIASDDFEGRATFTEGLGLAASYLAGELRAMGVKPGGDHGIPIQGFRCEDLEGQRSGSSGPFCAGLDRVFVHQDGAAIARECARQVDGEGGFSNPALFGGQCDHGLGHAVNLSESQVRND